MSRLFVYLGRLSAIVLGYICASLAASAFLHVLILGGQSWSAEETPYVLAGSAFVSVPFVALFVSYFAFMPTIPVLIVAEYLGRRDWLFFTLAGGVISLAMLFLYRFGVETNNGLDIPTLAAGLGATGMVGGIVYWLVAGRTSGMWLEEASR
ncbi:hypothetical protein [Mesorhizobium sp. CAU 1732]|uniref:hypothetical protein n=1 Tax=Mesorhizobium sp. CAU 1732 TaxID=3140358 RepID=UPI003260E07A